MAAVTFCSDFGAPENILAVQGTLKSLLQHHSSKASILGCSAFFTVQLSHPHTGQAPGDGEGQGGLGCCCPQGHKELDTLSTPQYP